MKTLNATHKKTPARIEEIIRAALDCFTQLGYNNTGMNEICNRAGASIGSIYHHFKSKEHLAARIYIEGIKNYQTGYIGELSKHSIAREGIYAIIRYHIDWVCSNPSWARYLFQMRHAEFMWPVEQEFEELNKQFFESVGAWFRKAIKAGEIRKLTPDLYPAILMGPCQEFTRLYLAGKTVSKPEHASNEFAESAWRALSHI